MFERDDGDSGPFFERILNDLTSTGPFFERRGPKTGWKVFFNIWNFTWYYYIFFSIPYFIPCLKRRWWYCTSEERGCPNVQCVILFLIYIPYIYLIIKGTVGGAQTRIVALDALKDLPNDLQEYKDEFCDIVFFCNYRELV